MYWILNIYKQNLPIVYKTTLCSKATFIVLLTTLFAVVLPFIFAYRSRGFWLKRDTFYEQPNVHFKGEYFFLGLTNNISDMVICNNIFHFPQLEKFDKCAITKVREIDKNHDGKADIFEFQLKLNFDSTLQHGNYLQYIVLIIPLDYRLKTMCPLKMQSAIIFQQDILTRANQVHITSNLQWKQKMALNCYPKYSDKLTQSIINLNLSPTKFYNDNVDQFQVQKIINDYLQRNFTTHLSETYTSYGFKSGNFELNLLVDYPEIEFYYRPGFWQVLKWAWMQYLAIYMVFAWVINKLLSYIFENNLVLVYKSLPTALIERLNKKYH